MARATPTISALIALLVIGTAAESAPEGSVSAASSLAGRPQYVGGGWQCPRGFVFRNAGPRDWLCVDPQEAQRIDEENERAADNWIAGPDGTRACRDGLVKRDAFTRDGVCVDPARREVVQEMNLALYTVR